MWRGLLPGEIPYSRLQRVLAEAVAFRTVPDARRLLFVHSENLMLGQSPAPGARDNPTRVVTLEERMAALAKSVAIYEAKREELQERRRGAIDSVMVELDEQLRVNANTLNLLRRTLELISLELQTVKRQPM